MDRRILIKKEIKKFISYKNLSMESKLNIANDIIVPDIMDTISKHFENETILFPKLNNNDIQYIIKTYTFEETSRQLYLTLKEMYGSFYLLDRDAKLELHQLFLTSHREFIDVLCNKYTSYIKPFPFLSVDHIKDSFKKTCDGAVFSNSIGIWAKNPCLRGIVLFKCRFNNSDTDKITPPQENRKFMKSLHNAKNIAWKFTPYIRKEMIKQIYKKISLDVPSVNLDFFAYNKQMSTFMDKSNLCGGSAGLALVINIYGLFNGIRIKTNQGFTGSLDRNGYIGKVNHLGIKIEAGLRAGLTDFFIPLENKSDMEDFLTTHIKDPLYNEKIKKINYTYISSAKELFDSFILKNTKLSSNE